MIFTKTNTGKPSIDLVDPCKVIIKHFKSVLNPSSIWNEAFCKL